MISLPVGNFVTVSSSNIILLFLSSIFFIKNSIFGLDKT
jgi:hypothetical protein